MSLLELKLAQALPQYGEEARALVREHGTVNIGSVNVAQAYGGMRGVNALVCDTSEVHPQQGLIIRGKQLGSLLERLPEEIFWLLLTGELPPDPREAVRMLKPIGGTLMLAAAPDDAACAKPLRCDVIQRLAERLGFKFVSFEHVRQRFSERHHSGQGLVEFVCNA